MAPTVAKSGESFWRHQAQIRCAVVALAIERFRIARSQWPESLDSLVPEFIVKIPMDPFDAKPLRYRRLNDGVVIYSIGPDEEDNGGKLDRGDLKKHGTDIGFRLWNVDCRRQPWHMAVKKTPDDN